MVTSAHKWIGNPWPSGIYLQRDTWKVKSPYIGFIGGTDSTFAGSRNGHSVLYIYQIIKELKFEEESEAVAR